MVIHKMEVLEVVRLKSKRPTEVLTRLPASKGVRGDVLLGLLLQLAIQIIPIKKNTRNRNNKQNTSTNNDNKKKNKIIRGHWLGLGVINIPRDTQPASGPGNVYSRTLRKS